MWPAVDEGILVVNQPQGFEVSEKKKTAFDTQGEPSALRIGMASERTEDLMCHS